MNLFEFKLLHQQQMIALLYKEGVYIGKRKLNGNTILLYQLDSFYVAIHYSSYRKVIAGIHSFASTAHLDPYLDQIPIESLVMTR